MVIQWRYDNETNTILGSSNSWTDDGSPLDYRLKYRGDPFANWRADFEGHVVAIGTVTECMAACEASDRDGEFRVNPDMDELFRESQDSHSNFGTE